MKQYRVKEEILDQFPQLFTQVNGKRVTLHGQSERVTIEATARSPRKEVVVPMATQTDLEQLYKEGNPFIEAVEEETKVKTEVKA